MSTTSQIHNSPAYLPDVVRLDKEGAPFSELSGAILRFFNTTNEDCASLELLLRANNCRSYLFPNQPKYFLPLRMKNRVCTYELFISQEPQHVKKVQQASKEEWEKRMEKLRDTGVVAVSSPNDVKTLDALAIERGESLNPFQGAEHLGAVSAASPNTGREAKN